MVDGKEEKYTYDEQDIAEPPIRNLEIPVGDIQAKGKMILLLYFM